MPTKQLKMLSEGHLNEENLDILRQKKTYLKIKSLVSCPLVLSVAIPKILVLYIIIIFIIQKKRIVCG